MTDRSVQIQSCWWPCEDLQYDCKRLEHDRQASQRRLKSCEEGELRMKKDSHETFSARQTHGLDDLADPGVLDLLAKPVVSVEEGQARKDLLARYGGTEGSSENPNIRFE